MKYGIADKLSTLLIAADTYPEYDEFVTRSIAYPPEGSIKAYSPDPIDIFVDDRYDGFSNVMIFDHASEEDRETFCRVNSVTIYKERNRVIEMQEWMLNDKNRLSELADTRTGAEILGLDKHDPWDKRTDEQKAQAEEMKKKYDEAKKSGKLSGDSFSPKKKDEKMGILEPRITIEADGSVSVTVPAIKTTEAKVIEKADDLNAPASDFGIPTAVFNGLDAEDNYILFVARVPHPTPMDDIIMRAFNLKEGERYKTINVSDPHNLVYQMKEEVAAKVQSYLRNDYDAYIIDGKDTVVRKVEPSSFGIGVETPSKKHWRTILGQVNTNDLIALFEREKSLFTSGYDPVAGWWVASMRKQTIVDVIASHHSSNLELVDRDGDVLLGEAAGLVLVDQNAVEEVGPRPWNDRADEWDRMTDEEREEERKKITGNEFVFCGEYHGAREGTIIYVTPKEYFLKSEKMWDAPLNIGHIMPNQFKEKTPGVYTSEAFSHWDDVARTMAKQKFNYDLLLQIHVNSI